MALKAMSVGRCPTIVVDQDRDEVMLDIRQGESQAGL